MTTLMKTFFFHATPAEAAELARSVGSKVTYLRSHIGVHRGPSAVLALRIERATGDIARQNGRATPVVPAHELLREWAELRGTA